MLFFQMRGQSAAWNDDMTTVLFSIAFFALIILNILLLRTLSDDNFRIWPTPGKGSWQYAVFWPLFRGGLSVTIIYSLLQLVFTNAEIWHVAIGIPIFLAGFGAAICCYFNLGIDNTYGSTDGLVTSGFYRFSRNPQSVLSIIGFVGLGIAAFSLPSSLLCALAVSTYVLMPFAEESWLEDVYGQAYRDYKARTARFVDLEKLLDKPQPVGR